MKKFFYALSNCNSNKENISFTVINGENLGEKALISDGGFIFFSDENGFLFSMFIEFPPLTLNHEIRFSLYAVIVFYISP